MLNIITKVQSMTNVGEYSQIVRVVPVADGIFPSYEAGQYAVMRRHSDGIEKFFSIASAPSETSSRGYLEFYISADVTRDERGRETIELVFNGSAHQTEFLLREIGGSFTLQQRARGYRHIVMVATGTGLSPFRSMIKELNDTAIPQHRFDVQLTLLQSHRTVEELAYLDELLTIENEGCFDLFYLPIVTRHKERITVDKEVSFGRVGSLLKMLSANHADLLQSDNIRFASIEVRDRLAERMKREQTMIMLCGNPTMVSELRLWAEAERIPCVSETR
jgi:ferredoxin-NADP reductase